MAGQRRGETLMRPTRDAARMQDAGLSDRYLGEFDIGPLVFGAGGSTEAIGEEPRTTWPTCTGESKACRRTPVPRRVRSKCQYRLQRGDTGGRFSGKTIRLITL